MIRLTCGVLISSTTPLNGVTKDAAFSDRQWRCPCFHRWRFPVMVRARTPSEMVNTTYKISPVIVFVHSDVLFRGRERVKEGGRLKKHFC